MSASTAVKPVDKIINLEMNWSKLMPSNFEMIRIWDMRKEWHDDDLRTCVIESVMDTLAGTSRSQDPTDAPNPGGYTNDGSDHSPDEVLNKFKNRINDAVADIRRMLGERPQPDGRIRPADRDIVLKNIKGGPGDILRTTAILDPDKTMLVQKLLWR